MLDRPVTVLYTLYVYASNNAGGKKASQRPETDEKKYPYSDDITTEHKGYEETSDSFLAKKSLPLNR